MRATISNSNASETRGMGLNPKPIKLPARCYSDCTDPTANLKCAAGAKPRRWYRTLW